MTTIKFDPDSCTYDLVAERPYLHADHRHAMLWLKGDGYSAEQARGILLHSFMLGVIADVPLTIHS